MRIPSYLRGYAADCCEDDEKVTVNIADSTGGRLFEIWYCGEPMDIVGFKHPLYLGTDFPSKFVAKSVSSGEEILLFDDAVHGYDNMFCITRNDEEINGRALKKMEIPPSEIRIELFYEIAYEDEKETYDFDENGSCILLNGTSIPWEQVKSDGIDAIALYYKQPEGKWIEFTEAELA